VHGVAVDPATRHVFVNDRNNHRIQVFDENGKYLYEWKIDADPSSLHLLYIGSGKTIWTYDRTTNKMVEWDLQGHLLYSWGTMGEFAGYGKCAGAGNAGSTCLLMAASQTAA
jgi:DNA-binding beta-propeller fold protein YncE